MSDSPVNASWPSNDLENVNACPCCGSASSSLLHGEMHDDLFNCPGSWSLFACSDCGSAYLNPRPTPGSIGRAYSDYLTHDQAKGKNKRERTGIKGIKHRIEHAYLRYRFAGDPLLKQPLAVFAYLFPTRRRRIDMKMRFIPRPDKPGRLLDLGCGNGSYLLRAQMAGWEAIGVDFDQKAISAALRNGLDVHRGDVNTAASHGPYDGITMSHIIEHVHHPLQVLTTCFEMLNPGGWLWLETPNIQAKGHEIFGSSWRGLESPRHLTLFNNRSLIDALRRIGFTRVEQLPYRPICKLIFEESASISQLKNKAEPYSAEILNRLASEAEKVAKVNFEVREFIALRVWKPA